MLRKKTNGVAIGSQTSSFIGKATEKVVDRRAFLKGSGLAVGGLATAAALVGSNVKPVQAAVSKCSRINEENSLYTLFCWMYGNGRSSKWCLDRSRARLG